MEHNKNNRPQEPQQPYPYHEEEVSYENAADQVVLSGILTLPNKLGIFPAVVLIAGYGPNDRNASGMGHKYFLVLADYLTRSGIAVLRFDKRGVGSSTGDYKSATHDDLLSDALAGVTFLKTRPEIDQRNIGLIGLSEGGLIAAMGAAHSPDISCAVLMAPAVATTIDDMLYHTALQLKADGASEEFIARDQVTRRAVCDIIRHEMDGECARQRMRAIIEQYLRELPESQQHEAEKLPFAFTQAKLDGMLATFSSPGYRSFLTSDHSTLLQGIKIPILVVTGGHDFISSAERTFPLFARAMELSGNECTLIGLPYLNHMFQTCKTGSLMEYGTIEETMSPAAMKIISDWILSHIRI